jgi:hypothetical protein
MVENLGTVIAVATCVIFLLGPGIAALAFLAGRGGRVTVSDDAAAEHPLPRRLVRELERCLELGDCITRDGKALASLLAEEPKTVTPTAASAAKQLLKTTKSLALRLQRVGAEAHIEAPSLQVRNAAQLSERNEIGLPLKQPAAGRHSSADADPAPPSGGQDGAFADVREFPRSSFQGSAEATIFPRRAGSGSEPVKCTVLTRDLSRSGISLGHSEQLFPKQIVVLETVGKLLVGQVRWCRVVDEKFYVAGCRLVGSSG